MKDEGFRTSMVLLKGPMADATVEVLAEDPQIVVKDTGPFLKVFSPSDIRVVIEDVAEAYGQSLTFNQWLVTMSSFVGRIVTDPDETTFMVCAGNPALEDAS